MCISKDYRYIFNILLIMLFNVLNKLKINGTLEIIDYKNNKFKFGSANPHVVIKLKSKS